MLLGKDVLRDICCVFQRICSALLLCFVFSGAFASTVQLKWYSNGTQVMNSGQCTYDSDNGIATIAPPAPKPGYVFEGWLVTGWDGCGVSDLPYATVTSWDSNHTRWKPINGSEGDTMADQGDGWVENSADLNNGEWAVTLSYGTIRGVSTCSAKTGYTQKQFWLGDPSKWSASDNQITAAGEGPKCWCKMTGFKPTNGDLCTTLDHAWILFAAESSTVKNCKSYCPGSCASYFHVVQADGFRKAILNTFQ